MSGEVTDRDSVTRRRTIHGRRWGNVRSQRDGVLVDVDGRGYLCAPTRDDYYRDPAPMPALDSDAAESLRVVRSKHEPLSTGFAPADDETVAYCWCGRTEVVVALTEIRACRTGSCGAGCTPERVRAPRAAKQRSQ